jgi:hypothetical protein
MDNQNLLEIFKLMMEYETLNEVTSTGGSGPYKAPLSPGIRLWDKHTLMPYIDRLNDYDDAELNYDALDGNISTKDPEKKEREAIKIAKSNKFNPVDNDDDGDNLNNDTPKSKLIKKLFKSNINEDLGVWFGTKKKPKGSKQPKGPWVNICRKDKDGKHPPCGRSESHSKGYPKCRAAGVAGKMSDSQKKSACQQKRNAEKTHSKNGTGNKPKMTHYEPKKKKTNESVLISLIRKSLD